MPDTGVSFRDSPLTRTEHHLSYVFYLLSGISTEGDGRGHFPALLRSAQTVLNVPRRNNTVQALF